MARLLLINFFVMITIIIINVYIRSQTIVEITAVDNKQTIETVQKYYDLFPTVTMYSLIILVLTLVISGIILAKSQYALNKRLQLLKTEFEQSSLSKIDETNTIYTEEDLIIIKAWNESIENINAQAQKREKYFNGMVHDFKTPLHILRLNMQMEVLENGKSRYKEKISEELTSFEEMIMRYLLVEKISFFEKPKPELRNLDKLFNHQKEKYKQLNYKINVESALNGREILVDEYMFDKVMSNVIDNAMKYGIENQMWINVIDNVIYLENKVENFQLDEDIYNSGKRVDSKKGNGLGVEIVNTYIALLGWRISSQVSDNQFIVKIEFK